MITTVGFSQHKPYARMLLDTLCAPYFDGRGYYNKGEERAANFIAEQYKEIGLKSVNNDYLQQFKLPTNAITGSLSLAMNRKILKAGKDFLVDASSLSYCNKAKVIWLPKEALLDITVFKAMLPDLAGRFVIIDTSLIAKESREVKGQVYEMILFLKYSSDIVLEGVIEVVSEKLTYGASQTKALRPHVIVLKEKIPKRLKELSLQVESEFVENHSSQNVIGFIEGEISDKYVFVTAHYDHLGRMGKEVYFPGANDNASGVAMLLSLAKDFAMQKKPKYSLVFICFGAEEIGLVGSQYYVNHPMYPLEDIQFLLNLDILGTGDDGVQVVNGSKHQNLFDNLVALNEKDHLLKQVKIRGEACNSDHCFFSEKGVPSFFMYTLGGIAHYHNIYDKSATLPLTEYDDLFVLLKKFIKEI